MPRQLFQAPQRPVCRRQADCWACVEVPQLPHGRGRGPPGQSRPGLRAEAASGPDGHRVEARQVLGGAVAGLEAAAGVGGRAEGAGLLQARLAPLRAACCAGTSRRCPGAP